MYMERTIIKTDNAPAAAAAYSQAVKANGFVFVSGQLGLDPGTGKLSGGSAGAQSETALRNIQAILEAAGSALSKIVKCTVLLADIADYAEVNGVYATFFAKDPPARAAYAVGNLPLDARVEIEAIALA
jgi:2-iminobutanoate/2-iminopropanoate deaminase